jgi:acetyl-CoA C-acetyltransferase
MPTSSAWITMRVLGRVVGRVVELVMGATVSTSYHRRVTGLDPRTPVIVGAGQITTRERGAEPIDLMTRCAEAALDDSAAAGGLRTRIDAVRVVWGVWPYRDPGRAIATRVGAPGARTTLTTVGGNQVYDLVIDTAARIAQGGIDVAVIAAAETLRTRRGDKAAGRRSDYLPEPEGAAPDEIVGSAEPLSNEVEDRFGVTIPTTFYAMAEIAIRHRTGETPDAHRGRIADLWARGSEVAAGFDGAWLRDPVTAHEVHTVTERNRPVAAPYPKLMVSNLDVDQGGAVVMCSAAAAEAAGVPRDRWVFPWAGVGAHDHWYVTHRWAWDESPAMRIAGGRTLELAGIGNDDCDLLDLYSCFPAAVQVAQRELAIDPQRDWTITGGLTFGGGPLNCYCILPLTRSVHLLRAGARRALLTGNGGWFTKHSMLVLAADPSAHGFRTDDVQADVDALPRRGDPGVRPAAATLETYTVTYGRTGEPDRGVLACLAADGTRHYGHTDRRDDVDALLAGDACGRPVALADDGSATLA